MNVKRKSQHKKIEKVKCWEAFHCKEESCPVYKKKDPQCWLFSGTHCRNEIQGMFLEKMEMCVVCPVFSSNMDQTAMEKTFHIMSKQLQEYKNLVDKRSIELESMSMDLAVGLSEIFEALKKIAAGDPSVKLHQIFEIELIDKLKEMVNMTAENIGEIVDLSHEFAIGLAEHFNVLHRVSTGDLHERVRGISQIELLESLKKVTNDMIDSISREIDNRRSAEAALLKAYDELEERVEERTAELKLANEQLRHEIEERKRVEINLRKAELQCRTVADFTYDWEYWEAPDGKLLYISPSCERITGYKAKYFIENPNLIQEITIPEDREIWSKHRHGAFQNMNPHGIQFRINRQDGEIRWIEHVCQSVIDKKGKFLGVRASNRDITMRRHAEKELNDTLSLLTATLESTTDGILVVDRKGKITIFNKKFLQMWQIPESIIGLRDDEKALSFVLEQLIEPAKFLSKIKELYSSPEAESFDILVFKDGRIFERYSQPQKIGDSIVGRVWSFRDITERKKTEKALRESEQILIQTHKMEAIGKLAAGIAHEINNPLAIINEDAGLMSDLLEILKESQQNKDKFKNLINSIFDNVNRSRIIIHRLLGFSRRTDGIYREIDLNDTVKEVIGFVEKEILYRSIHLELNLQENILKVVTDKGRLQQVVLNIINNAIDAVEKGGHIKVFTNRNDDEHMVSVSIRDDGPGIPKEAMKHIFEPFYTTKEKGKGTGLGLAISYGIIRNIGGRILAQSKPYKETTFIIEIPYKAETISGGKYDTN